MVRGGQILVMIALATGLLWFVAGDAGEPRGVDPHGAAPGSEALPTLAGNAPEVDPALVAIPDPTVELRELLTTWDETAAARLMAAAGDPRVLAALVAQVVAEPDTTSVGTAGTPQVWQVERWLHQVLATIGAPAATALAAALHGADVDARVRLLKAIGAVGPPAAVVVPTLLARLGVKDDAEVRASIIHAFAAIGTGATAALPQIHAGLRNVEVAGQFRRACAAALVPVGGATDTVFDTLRVVFQREQYRAGQLILKSLAPLGSKAEPMIPVLITLYDLPRGADQFWGLVPAALGEIGVASEPVIGFLRDTYWHAVNQELDSTHVLQALARLGPRGQAEVLALAASEASGHARLGVIQILDQGGMAQADLVKLIAPSLSGGDVRAQVQALSAFRGIGVGPGDQGLIVPLLEAEDAEVRSQAIYTLGRMADPPIGLLDVLAPGIGDADARVRRAAVYAIAAHHTSHPARVLALLREGAGSPHRLTRTDVLNSLAPLAGQFPAETAEIWLAALDDPGTETAAAVALSRFGGKSPAVTAALVALLAHEDVQQRLWGARGLAQRPARAHLELMLAASRDADLIVRAVVISALSSYRTFDPDRVRQRWIEALDEDWPVSGTAAALLAELGAAARAAIPKLEELSRRKYPYPYMANGLAQSLAKIRAAVAAADAK